MRYTNPNYDFLGNSINYSVSSQKNDKPDQGYENSIVSGKISTSFEQYRNIIASLGLSVSYDDLQTTSNASSSLKNKVVNLVRLQEYTVLLLTIEIELLCPLAVQ